jgi:predicted RNase H-like HicB family nuclease
MKTHEYAVQIVWSKEDQAYLAVPFELAGCVADGQTPEEALANLRVIIEEWIDVAKEQERKIPAPLSTEDLDRLADKQHEFLRQQIEATVNAAVKNLLGKLAAASIERGEHHFQGFGFSRMQFEPAGFGRR